MARTRRRVAAALAAILAVLVAAALPAAALRTLHVDKLSMRADRTHLAVGEAFHLAIHVVVRENVTAVDELVVPDVGTMQILGDERHVTGTPAGTDVVETLTIEPRVAGTFTLPGAYLDAVDARTHKPTRFSANPVQVVVGEAAPISPVFVRQSVVDAALVLGVLGAILCTVILVALRKTPGASPPPAPVVVAPPAPRRTARDAVADALRAYRTAQSHDTLMALRAALFAVCGAAAGSTLRDALARTTDERLRAALTAAEHAAFGPANVRDAASAELIETTEAWLR